MMKNQLSIFYEHIADAAAQTGLPLEAVCGKVKGFGYDLVEIDAKRLFEEGETILPVLEKAGLGVNCIYYFSSTSAARRARRRRTARWRSALSACAARQNAARCSPSRAF